MQSQSYTADVAGTDSTGKCRSQRLKMAGIAFSTVLVEFAGGYSDRMLEIPNLGKPKINRKKYTYGQQQGGKPYCTTQKAVQKYQKIINCVQSNTPFALRQAQRVILNRMKKKDANRP